MSLTYFVKSKIHRNAVMNFHVILRVKPLVSTVLNEILKSHSA